MTRNIVCPSCQQELAVPADLAQAHCVRCGQVLTITETAATASLAHAIQPTVEGEYVPAPAPIHLDETRGHYADWDDFRSNSPAVQRELLALASRAMPDLRSMDILPIPEDAPAEMDSWGKPLGTLVLAREQQHWQVLGWAFLIVGILMLAGVGAVLTQIFTGGREPQAERIAGTFALTAFGSAFLMLGVYGGFFRGYSAPTALWIFEEGVFLHRHDGIWATRWEAVQHFESVPDASGFAYLLTIGPEVSVRLANTSLQQTIPLMEYVELRLCAAQFLGRLNSLWDGKRETFGIVRLTCQGFEGPDFFAPWSEIRRVVPDARALFVDWSQRPDWVPFPLESVSFPHLVIALASVLVEEHGRFAPSST